MCSKLESVERMADNLTFPVITDLIRMKASSPRALVPISASSFLVDTTQDTIGLTLLRNIPSNGTYEWVCASVSR